MASDVVLTSLPGPPEVEQVVFDPVQGLLSALRPDTAYIDLTTNAPALAHRIAAACQERHVAMLDAPVSGRPPEMTIMAGGDARVFATYQPLLASMGRHVIYVGSTGTGCIAELVSQYLGYANFIAAAEGLLMGAKAGVDLHALAQIIPVSAGASRAFETFPRTVYSGAFASPGTLDIVAKDLRLACDLAHTLQTPCQMGDIVVEVLQRAQAQGLGSRGYPIAIQVLEDIAGVTLRAPQAPASAQTTEGGQNVG
jgi:3-hydroxyisobutyrate dehydrogenase-like beta-hydroxyacid dehydrogenase